MGSTTGVELARRARDNNRGNRYGQPLTRIASEVEEDRDALLALMEELELSPDRVKVALGWAGEKVGRLKPNGRLLGYSPLSRVVEIEGLFLGVTGKLSLWENLQACGPGLTGRINSVDLDALIERARSQRSTLEGLRLDAAAEALTQG